jgi:hypothetical protein
LGEHPWSLTLRQFLEKIERELGAEYITLYAVGPRGRANISYYLRKGSPELFATVLEIDPDAELTPTVLRSICAQLGIPPDIIGLEEEEPYFPPPDA